MKSLGCLLIILFASCQSDEADIPEIITEDAQQIGSTSVVMGSELKETGPAIPVNYGFLWDTQPDISLAAAGNKLILGSTGSPKKFSIKLDNLSPNTKYYYRGFCANGDYTKIFYGNIVSFTSLP